VVVSDIVAVLGAIAPEGGAQDNADLAGCNAIGSSLFSLRRLTGGQAPIVESSRKRDPTY